MKTAEQWLSQLTGEVNNPRALALIRAVQADAVEACIDAVEQCPDEQDPANRLRVFLLPIDKATP